MRGSGLDRNAELIVRRDLGVLPPEELTQRCKALGAELLPTNADFCARFDFAPRYPMWLKIWFADEEFPASGRLLLDESAPHYLTIEDAVTAASFSSTASPKPTTGRYKTKIRTAAGRTKPQVFLDNRPKACIV